MPNYKINIITALMMINSWTGQSKDFEKDSMAFQYDIETTATFSGGANTPFWLVSNIHGLGSPEFNNGYVRASIFKKMELQKEFSWGAGADIAGSWNLTSPFSIRQLYGELHYRALWISLGSKNYKSEYNDTRLSSGDLLFSGNAMAIPQLRIGTKGFEPFWGTKDWLNIKTYLSYGIFTDSRWIKNWVFPGSDRNADILFCSRGLWFRVGNTKVYPLTLDIGIEMATQFGGTIYKDGKHIKMPSGFKDWIKALIPFSGSDKTPAEEQTNIQGNMNGEYNVAFSWMPSEGWNIKGYFEHYFEDQSQMTFEYGTWKDGLWGLNVNFPQNDYVAGLVYEYVSTADQTGAINHDSTPEIPEQVSGRDGYYTHYLYGAWQNWGMSIGTPLAISPLYNRSRLMTLYNTRFKAHHIGMEGSPVNFLKWRMLYTFSRNWGTYIRPLPERMDNFSGLIELEFRLTNLQKWTLRGAVAWDHGALLGNNFGGVVSLSYQGDILINR